MPKFRVFRPIGPDISEAAERLFELTETQAQVFEGLYAQDRVLVEGVAGSGKTFLALHRAIAFARASKRTLFVCYNKELAAWLRVQVEEDSTTLAFREYLTVKNFHSLAAGFYLEIDKRFTDTSPNFSEVVRKITHSE
jgi:Rad3-related DNA helicase